MNYYRGSTQTARRACNRSPMYTQSKNYALIINVKLAMAFLAFIGSFAISKENATWFYLAERLSGESDAAHKQTIASLRAIPDLTNVLTRQIQGASPKPDTKTFLAFDVIATLGMHDLLPVLRDFSQKDKSGYSYHAMNSLITASNQSEIVALYRDRAVAANTSPAARIALIDTLARLNSLLDVGDVKRLLRHPSIEVRATTLGYLRSFLLRGKQPGYAELVQIPIADGPQRLKLQAEYLLHELSEPKGKVSP